MSELIIIAGFLLLNILFIFWFLTPEYEKCYTEMENEGHASMGCCCGLAGGTKETDYLSEVCIGCPHLVLTDSKGGKE